MDEARRRSLLIATYYFPPCGAAGTHRSLGLARYLPKFGWDVTVLAPSKVKWEPHDPSLLEFVPRETRVIPIEFPEGVLYRQLSRIMPYEQWLPGAWKAMNDVIGKARPDAIYTTSPPGCINYLGILAKQRFGLPWIACFRDPWITNLVRYRRSALWKTIETPGEAKALKLADRIMLNTPSSLRDFKAVHPDLAHKCFLMTNGFDPAMQGQRGTPAGAAGPGPLRLLHAGDLYLDRNPQGLLQALKRLNGTAGPPRFLLTLLGRISQELTDPTLSGAIELKPQVGYLQSLDAMSKADILVVIQGREAISCIPSKLYEYLGAGRPVLALVPKGCDVEWVLQKSGSVHRVADPADAAGIVTAMAELADEIAHGRVRPAEQDSLTVFTREYVARQLAGHLDAVRAAGD